MIFKENGFGRMLEVKGGWSTGLGEHRKRGTRKFKNNASRGLQQKIIVSRPLRGGLIH